MSRIQDAHVYYEIDEHVKRQGNGRFNPESPYRQLMCYHCRMNDKGKALQVYKECLRALKVHWDVEPSPETQSLYEHICSDQIPKPLDRRAALAVSS